MKKMQERIKKQQRINQPSVSSLKRSTKLTNFCLNQPRIKERILKIIKIRNERGMSVKIINEQTIIGIKKNFI